MVVAWNFYKHFTPSGVSQSAQPITNDSAHWCKIKVATNNNLNEAQRKTLQRFKRKLAQEMPNLRIAWVQPYNDTIIELHIDYDKHTYRKSLKASKLAFDVEEKTGITMIFR